MPGSPAVRRPGASRGSASAPRHRPTSSRRAPAIRRWDGSQQVADLDADEILDALADDVMAEGDLAEALRRLMERGWRTGDPSRGDMAGLQRPDGAPRAPARGDARALPARRRPGRHPARARRDRRRGTGGRRAPARPGLRTGDGRRPKPGGPEPWSDRPTDRRASGRCSATSPPAGSTSSTACRRMSASGSAACRTTTSSNRTRASASMPWSSGSRARSSTSSCPGCPRRSGR